jgi:hypothetical protein
MDGSVHIPDVVARRLSVAGVLLWLGLSAGLATAVGVAAWSVGHPAGGRDSPADVRQQRAEAYARGVAAGRVRRASDRAGRRRLAAARRASYEHGYAAGYRAGRKAAR